MTSLDHYLATAFQQVLQCCTQSTPGRARNLIFFFFFPPSVSPACAELISQTWVCPSRLNSVRDRPSFTSQWRWSAHRQPPCSLILSANREPSGLQVALEHKDPPACRECLEKEEAPAFLDPRETESVLTHDCLTSDAKTAVLSFDWLFQLFNCRRVTLEKKDLRAPPVKMAAEWVALTLFSLLLSLLLKEKDSDTAKVRNISVNLQHVFLSVSGSHWSPWSSWSIWSQRREGRCCNLMCFITNEWMTLFWFEQSRNKKGKVSMKNHKCGTNKAVGWSPRLTSAYSVPSINTIIRRVVGSQ